MVLNTRVLKEPRGFIRIIQCIMAILAFSTTAGFDTSCSFSYKCGDETQTVKYSFGYPFLIRDNVITVHDCHDMEGTSTTTNGDPDGQVVKLPFDFSSTSEFYVATGVLSFLYTIIALLVYLFLHQTYASDPKVPVIDLALSAIIAVFWLTGSSAWAQGVRDLKFYLHPDSLFGFLSICKDHECTVVHEGEYAELNVSLIFGFTCFVLWFAGLWFIYKETVFHTPAEAAVDVAQNQSAKGDGRV